MQEIRHETPLEGVRGVEGRPGRAAQRDDEVFPGAGELFDGRFFGEGDPPAGGRGELHALRQEYEQDRDIRIEDEFGISDSAVKKQARSYKSVIKLDRNFHIYVHGNRNLLEQGEDEKGKFYKVYYEEEE